VAAEIRRGKKEDRKKLQGKNIMAPLLHRAAIIKCITGTTKQYFLSENEFTVDIT